MGNTRHLSRGERCNCSEVKKINKRQLHESSSRAKLTVHPDYPGTAADVSLGCHDCAMQGCPLQILAEASENF